MPDDHDATVQRITEAMHKLKPAARAAVYSAGAWTASQGGEVGGALAAMDKAASALVDIEARLATCRGDAMADWTVGKSRAVGTAD